LAPDDPAESGSFVRQPHRCRPHARVAYMNSGDSPPHEMSYLTVIKLQYAV